MLGSGKMTIYRRYLLNLFSHLLHLRILLFHTLLLHLDLIFQICFFTLQTRDLLKSTSTNIFLSHTTTKTW